MTATFRMVDAHHHLWDLGRHDYDWLMGDGWPEKTARLGDYAGIRRDYLVEEFIRDAVPSGVVKSVHLQADWTGPDPDPVNETRWLQAAADRTGFPHAIVAWEDLRAPDLDARLARHGESPNLRGIRIVPDAAMLEDPAFRRGLVRLGVLGLSFDLAVTPDLMPAASRLVRAIPDTVVVLEHTGLPVELSRTYFETWRRALRSLSELQSVTIKISGLGTVDHHWTTDGLRPWVLEAIEQFGANRTMFATNWPVDRLYSTYEALIAAYRAIVAGASETEQSALFAGTAERVYRIQE